LPFFAFGAAFAGAAAAALGAAFAAGLAAGFFSAMVFAPSFSVLTTSSKARFAALKQLGA
jgi:hypothetical protein